MSGRRHRKSDPARSRRPSPTERKVAALRERWGVDPTHNGVVPPECRGTPSGAIDSYSPSNRRLFKLEDTTRFWIGDRVLRLTHGPTGISAEGEGEDEREALIAAGTVLEARLVFVRIEKELGIVGTA